MRGDDTKRELQRKRWRLPPRKAAATLFRVESLDAVFLQTIAEIAEVLLVARFDGAKNVDGRNIGTGKSAIMHDLFNARAG